MMSLFGFGSMAISDDSLELFDMEIDLKHTHKFCVRHSISVNSYKHVTLQSFYTESALQ
jgi:hypothetical protein